MSTISEKPRASKLIRGQTQPSWITPWMLLVVVGVSAGLRLPGLVAFPFEQDELYTLIESTELFDSPLHPGIQARPLYYLLHHMVIEVLPQTHFGLRLPALLFGVLGVWLTWVLGSRTIGDVGGLVAVLLVAISPWHMHASGMARYWSLIYLLATAFYLCLHRASRTGLPHHYLSALLFLVLGVATHPAFVFPVLGAAVGLYMVGAGDRLRPSMPSRNAIIYLWGPVGVGALLLVGLLFITNVQYHLRNFDGRGIHATLRLIPAMVQWMTPTIFAAGLLGSGLLLAESRGSHRQFGAMVVGGTCVALLFLFLASLVTDVYADYGVAMLPLLFVSSGALVQLTVPRGAGRGYLPMWGMVAVLNVGVLPSTISHLSDGTRFDHRPAFDEIRRKAPELLVLTWPIVIQQRYAPELHGRELIVSPSFLEEKLIKERDFWAVISVQRNGIVSDEGGDVQRWLNDNCTLSASHQRPRIDYRVYRTDLYRCRI